ncbi:PadR family transcriptional regulator [Clostridium sp. CCUG 7971]|uniref:PadR family transcriptional regulator n=1 Tax=Clostridium sp. CCUG 7971 TaxID=2811414 RepID=UPI001ABAC829|nr:PadR family transcriptional regulator [Clostridium sp. CCUG 7971]MBO3446128.1 PadR family transcriptional regulator [Clostridium sp. CCUG 7971]
MKINKELLKGSTTILILSLLKRKPMYGYEIIKEIELKSSGVFNFKEGTLYPILHTLESNEMVESFWSEGESSRKRKYYKITDKGNKQLKEKEDEWKLFTNTVNTILLED